MRISTADLEQALKILQTKQPWVDYSIGKMISSGYRLERNKGSVAVTPYTTKREVYRYIGAMLTALDLESERPCNQDLESERPSNQDIESIEDERLEPSLPDLGCFPALH